MDIEFIGLRSNIVYKEVVYSAEEVAEELERYEEFDGS